MARSHPPTLLTSARRTLVEECGVREGERVLVAVSGGGDSTALLHVLARLAPKLGIDVVAHGVDHGLRAAAAAELDGAAALAAALGVPFARSRLTVAPGGNLQARARDARLAALREAADAVLATRIATAHHADDRAETVLLRLLHGATPAALAVLPPASGVFVRPLIRARKRDVLAHLGRHHLTWAEDPSNRDPRFLRVRVRLELLPLLESLSPGIVAHLNALSDELGRAPHPSLADEGGLPLRLGRAQRVAIQRARTLGRAARIRVADDEDVVVEAGSGRLRVDRAAPGRRGRDRPRRGDRGGDKGGANSPKSG